MKNNEFKQFMKNLVVWNRYQKNLKEAGYTLDDLKNVPAETYVDYFFSWDKTQEKEDFWIQVNELWCGYLKLKELRKNQLITYLEQK